MFLAIPVGDFWYRGVFGCADSESDLRFFHQVYCSTMFWRIFHSALKCEFWIENAKTASKHMVCDVKVACFVERNNFYKYTMGKWEVFGFSYQNPRIKAKIGTTPQHVTTVYVMPKRTSDLESAHPKTPGYQKFPTSMAKNLKITAVRELPVRE